jgi:large subunit ribosomal protein L21
MYAVIKAGSRQFKVTEGQTLTIDRVPGKEGETYTFNQVLMVGGDKVKVGTPTLAGASVAATIKSQTKDAKVTTFRYKRRKNYKRTVGHRQPITILEIGKIKV